MQATSGQLLLSSALASAGAWRPYLQLVSANWFEAKKRVVAPETATDEQLVALVLSGYPDVPLPEHQGVAFARMVKMASGQIPDTIYPDLANYLRDNDDRRRRVAALCLEMVPEEMGGNGHY